MFALTLFGGLALERAGACPVPPGALQRRRLTLLALLALAGERGLSRERVQAHLWPESSADRARHALDQLLYATRRDLGRTAILSATNDLRLDPAVVRPDLWSFDEAVHAARWADAVALYRGPLLSGQHLLDDADFERWVDAERTRREQDYHRALEALAADASRRGDREAVVRWWRQRAASDPFGAPATLQLMRALADAGDRAGAVRQARVHQQLVRDSLEVEPDPAVAALATALATGLATTLTVTPGAAEPSALAGVAPPRVAPVVPPAPTLPPDPAPPALAPPPLPPGRRRLAGVGVLALALCTVAAVLVLPGRTVYGGRASTPPAAAWRTKRAAGGGSVDPEARRLYLRARDAWNRRTPEGLDQAVVQFRRATEIDPEYADAFSGLAESYAMLGYFGFEPADAMFPKARAAANRALELDPDAGGAYAALGQVLCWEHRWAEAEEVYRHALAVAPDDPTVHQWYGLMLAYVGRTHEAALHTGEASRLDPLSVQINNMYGMMLYDDGDLRGALHQYRRTVVAEPDSAWVRQNPWVLTNYATVAAAAGERDQALQLIDRALRVVPTHPRALLDLAHLHILAGQPDRARAAFARADTTHPFYPVYHAELYALLGETDSAFASLSRVKEWALPSLVGLNSSPSYARLRADPRYRALRARLGMPPR